MVRRTVIENQAPALVEELIATALDHGASDLYFLPDQETIRVRMRQGGAQQDLQQIPRPLGEHCLAHLEVLAGLLTYRTQIAQDGVIRRDRDGHTAELRVATMPTLFGERITIRLLDNRSTPKLLADLGMSLDTVAAMRRMLARPSGLIVLTGPTGCGKTTTIYGMIRELLRDQADASSIITLEDPVESVIPGISQASVAREKEEWNYPVALRAALRQDVRTLVVGEMRDAGVARVVLDAALTGHRVITTYHAGDIAAVYARMLHQGFEPFLVASAITGVVSQRLATCTSGQMIPVVATLEADDPWRDFIASFPRLEEIRQQARNRPGADLASEANRLHAAGLITETEAGRIGYA